MFFKAYFLFISSSDVVSVVQRDSQVSKRNVKNLGLKYVSASLTYAHQEQNLLLTFDFGMSHFPNEAFPGFTCSSLDGIICILL